MSGAEHGTSFQVVGRPRKRRLWCAAHGASGRRCNTVVKVNGRLCPFHERLVSVFELEAERLRQIEGQVELREFLRVYRHTASSLTTVAKLVLDEGRPITPVRAARLGKIAAKEALELTNEYRAGRMPERETATPKISTETPIERPAAPAGESVGSIRSTRRKRRNRRRQWPPPEPVRQTASELLNLTGWQRSALKLIRSGDHQWLDDERAKLADDPDWRPSATQARTIMQRASDEQQARTQAAS